MKKLLLAVTTIATIVTTPAYAEILKCVGSIVNSKNEFENRITVHIDVVVPDENAEEYILTLADKKTGACRGFTIYPIGRAIRLAMPLVRKTFIEITKSLDKGGCPQPERYDFIVTKMPDANNSLVGFVYGYAPYILKVDTWKKNKPFTLFQPGFDGLFQGECKCQ